MRTRHRVCEIACRRGVLAALTFFVGCGGPPQLGVFNYDLIQGLRTATSAQRGDWLEATARLIEERRASGKLDESQFAALQAIVAQARAGDWAGAEVEAIRVAKGQRATQAEAAELKSRKASRSSE